MKYKQKFAEAFTTVLYIGKIKYASGTFGSLPAFPLYNKVMHFTLNHKIVFLISNLSSEAQQLLTVFVINLLVTILLFFIGMYTTAIYIQDKDQKDPKEVVIDETVGQMLTIILSSFSALFIYNSSLPNYLNNAIALDLILLFILPFILFRVFDILKPWPINWLNKNVKGAFGVMIDDIAAALFAVVAQYVIVFFIIKFFPIKITT